MNVDELYGQMTKHLTAEEALKKLIHSSIPFYEGLKFDKGQKIHPVLIISMAAMDMGWNFVVENHEGNPEIRGLTVGTVEYLDEMMNKKTD